MKLSDYKKTGMVSATPENDLSGPGDDRLQSLIGEMKEKDEKDRKALLVMVIIFGMFVVIYITGMKFQKGIMNTGYALLAGGFLYSLLFFYIKLMIHKRIDYAAPTLIFLKKAERRYAYWPLPEIIIDVPPFVMMGIGGGMIVYYSFNKYFPGSMVPLIIFCLIYAAAFLVGHYAGKKMWRKEKQPVYEKIRRMRMEFSE